MEAFIDLPIIITIVIIMTIKTNGVSFSLVAGSVCWIYFSNGLNGGDLSTTTGWTMNLNSTGAKNIRRRTYRNGKVSEDTYTWYTGTSTGSLLFCYSGSVYYTATDDRIYSYSDD